MSKDLSQQVKELEDEILKEEIKINDVLKEKAADLIKKKPVNN